MRKIIALLLAVVICAGAATAQIIRTESHSITVMEDKKPKVDHGHNFLVKAGAGFMADDCYGNAAVKYSAILGFQKQFSRSGLYWGAQAGLNAVLCIKYGEWGLGYRDSAPAISLGPTLGIKRSLGLNTTFDSHIGVGYAIALASDDEVDNDDKHRVIWEVGAGVWFNRFLVELEYQGSHGYLTDNGLLLNVGFKF